MKLIQNSKELLCQAVAMAENNDSKSEQLIQLWRETDFMIRSLEATAVMKEQKFFFHDIAVLQAANAAVLEKVYAESRKLKDLFERTTMPAAFEKIMQVTRSAPEEIQLDQQMQEQHTLVLNYLIDHGPVVWEYWIGIAQLTISSLTYFEMEVYRAFLNQPALKDDALGALWTIAKAVGEEIIGEIIPFTGIIEALIEVTRPHIEKENKKLRAAVKEMDRVYLLKEQLTYIARQAQESMRVIDQAESNLVNNERDFNTRAGELIRVWSAE